MTLTINPGRNTKVQKNPLCPECKMQIIPVDVTEDHTVYMCGCDSLKQFEFTKRSDMTEDITNHTTSDEENVELKKGMQIADQIRQQKDSDKL